MRHTLLLSNLRADAGGLRRTDFTRGFLLPGTASIDQTNKYRDRIGGAHWLAYGNKIVPRVELPWESLLGC